MVAAEIRAKLAITALAKIRNLLRQFRFHKFIIAAS